MKKQMRVIVSVVLALSLGCAGASVAFADEPAGEPTAGEAVAQAGAAQEEQAATGQGRAVEAPAPAPGDAGQRSTSTINDDQVAEALQGVGGAMALRDSTGSSTVVSLFGTTLYDTAAREALYAFSRSKYAIVASGESYVDALSATSLAGALDCPILLTPKTSLPEATADALAYLGVEHVVIAGGEAVVSAQVAQELASYGTVERLFGTSQYDTQLAIYRYGAERGMWGQGETVILASGSQVEGRFADALSVSPIAFSERYPVFLVDDEGDLPEDSASALLTGGFARAIIAGGNKVVSDRTAGFLEFVTLDNGGARNVERLYGSTLYDTSAAIARWAVESGILTWDGAAFATGSQPYDALAGCSTQGRDGSVLLLIDEGYTAALDAAAASGERISTVKFFGGTSVVTEATRALIGAELGITMYEATYAHYDITLDELVALEYQASSRYTEDAYRAALDPAGYGSGDASFYQFALLSDGYSGLTADELDDYIEKMVVYQEENYNVKSNLRGAGAYFVEAAQTYDINEVYLLAHAALESAWGCSALSQGTVKGYEGYLNFYGIGAYDIDPDNGGAAMAKSMNWATAKDAILGAAKWIADNYVHPTVASARVSGAQDTLYKMKWDVRRAASDGAVWHQYATGLTWADGIAAVMDGCYSSYGIRLGQAGLTYEIPRYRS